MHRVDVPPIRTTLNTRGDDIDLVRAAAEHGPDAVWIDLEEPRTPFTQSQRAEAREAVGEFLRSLDPVPAWPRYLVRVQDLGSGGTVQDLEAVLCDALAVVIQPKVQGPEDVRAMDAILTGLETERGMRPGRTLLYPILETAQALRRAYAIATASPRVTYMGGAVSRFGDIVQALGYRWTPAGVESAMFRAGALVDGRAAGLPHLITGNWGGDLDDVGGLLAWARQCRDLGYHGTMTSHPPHVPVLNQVFSPTSQEIAYWRELDALATAAERDGTGPIRYGDPGRGEGHVVHLAHVGSARMNLAWAESLRDQPVREGA